MNEQPSNPENKESGLPHAKEVWLVDDDEPGGELMERVLGSVLADAGYSYRYFREGAKVLEEIDNRRAASNGQPHIIIMDGSLSSDPRQVRYGSEAIDAIRALENITQPTILAYSSDPELNKNMIKAGANQILAKPTSANEIRTVISGKIATK